VLDAQAKAEYKRRLKDLQQELEEAERFNDFYRAAKAQHEVNAISRYLACAIGLAGRDRKTSSQAERARSAVTKRIKRAIRKTGEAIPSLGHHLSARIKAGYFCSYNPHPDRPVVWKF
jgi:non-specific serine/threonine protein kinase